MKHHTILPVAALALVAALTSGCKQDKGVNAESPTTTNPGYTTPAPSGPTRPLTTPGPSSNGTTPTLGTPGADSTQNLAALKVKNALMTSSKGINAKNIDVTSEGGAIHLRGTVSTSAQKTAAEKAAKEAAGSTPIKSHLTVGK